MRKWHTTVCCILAWMMPTPTVNFRTQEMGMLLPKFEPTPKIVTQKMSAAKVIPNSISKFFGQTKEKLGLGSTTVSVKTVDDAQFMKNRNKVKTLRKSHEPPVKYAGLPRNLTVSILHLDRSDHELQFNVSWLPSLGRPAEEFSVEIHNVTNTTHCKPPLCYVSGINGNSTWVLIPETVSQLGDSLCAIRPNCSYIVNLKPHLWDGNSSLTTRLDLKECEEGVCSCEYSQYLPKPNVNTSIVMIEGDMFTNITWTLPKPRDPQLLPPAKVPKLSYIVSLSKQVVVKKNHLIPWFVLIEQDIVKFDGRISEGDNITRSLRLPLSKRNASNTPIPPTAEILAKVRLKDDRGCLGPEGEATAFKPEKPTKSQFPFGIYAIVGALLGVWAMVIVLVLSTRIVKHVLKSFRPAPVSAPREPLRRRPAWFPLQLRTLGAKRPAPSSRRSTPVYLSS